MQKNTYSMSEAKNYGHRRGGNTYGLHLQSPAIAPVFSLRH